VTQITGDARGVTGLVVDGHFRPFDSVLCTLAPPQARRLLAPGLAESAPADHCRYLGVVCLLLRVSRSVSPYYHLNITDRRVKLTTVVETTHVVDPDAVGGHLVYVSRYVDAGTRTTSAPWTRSSATTSATPRRSSRTCATTRSSRASCSAPA
jgi:protoporphyrinogen oxidase